MDIVCYLWEIDHLIPNILTPAAMLEKNQGQMKAKDAHQRAIQNFEKIASLEVKHAEFKKDVKRKVSDVAKAEPSEQQAQAEELLNLTIEQRANMLEMYQAGKFSLLCQFNYGTLPEQTFYESLRNLQYKERTLLAGDVTINRNRERILRNIRGLIGQHKKDAEEASEQIAYLFHNILTHKSVDREAEQKLFRRDLIGHYECQPKGLGSNIWCPIYKDWYFHKLVRAAHIVPYKLGYQTMGDLFGEEQRGHKLMWSMGNGMIMHKHFEKAFDEFIFCLVPIEKPGEPDGWKIILIDEGKRHEKVNAINTWDFYDGTELQFLNKQRPSHRFLYFHYFFCIYKSLQERTPGWQIAREKSGTKKIWATPGPYLRVSMLQKLATVIGDEVELPEKILENADIAIAKDLEAETETTDVKDLTSVMVPKNEFIHSHPEEEDSIDKDSDDEMSWLDG